MLINKNQIAFPCLQNAGHQPAAGHGQHNFPQLPAGIAAGRVIGAWAEARFLPGKQRHNAAGDRLADSIADEHRTASVSRAPVGQLYQRQCGHGHPHGLLHQLGNDIRFHPSPRQKAPPQRPGRRNKRQAGGQRTQPQLRAGIMQSKAGQRVRQRQLRQHGGGAQYGRCCRKAAQRRGHAAPTGQALRTQPCGCHIDARRSQRNKHHIDG